MNPLLKKLDLAGNWNIASADKKHRLVGPMPGSILQELEKAGVFGEKGLFWREANRAAPALMDQEWTLSRTFVFEGAAKNLSLVELVCEGLDTLATLKLNGRLLGKTDNMHRTWRFDVSKLLKVGQNQIEIKFGNALEYIKLANNKRKVFDAGGGGETMKGFPHLRKSHCSFGWDWGPQAPDAGIWRPIRLEQRPAVRLDSVRTEQVHADRKVRLSLSPEFVGETSLVHHLVYTLVSPEGQVIETKTAPKGTEFEIKKPELWWPVDMGAQPLYTVITECFTSDKQLLERHEMKLGLRTLYVDRSPLKEGGERFVFVANGIPFFARGADWIPEDVFLTRPTPASTRRLLEDAKLAHFNNIRVWGGGVYPDDQFFELCDELGLVVWQDLMFACATYPWDSDAAFRATTLIEVRENVRRLRHHACLGLICGNNEMEWGFEEWESVAPTKRMRREYLEMYQIDFARIIAEECSEAFYWPASPSSGGDFEKPNDSDKGDVHFWHVWHGRKPFEEYAKHEFRFLSEFGFESFPSLETCASFTLPEERNLLSPVMEDHQRCTGGNGTILYYMSEHLRITKDFKSSLLASQFIQAEAMRFGIEHLRRHRGVCMGAVYWQFNDNWPVASWSSVDYYGRWKMLHYVARRIFAPVLLSCQIEGKKAEIHLSNESRFEASGTVSWQLLNLDGKILKAGRVAKKVKTLDSQTIFALDFSKELAAEASRHHVLAFQFEGLCGPETLSLSGTSAFERIKKLELPDPELKWKLGSDKTGLFVEVSAGKFAKCVWLETAGVEPVFSDNAFDLAPGQKKRLRLLRQENGLDEKKLGEALSLSSARHWYD